MKNKSTQSQDREVNRWFADEGLPHIYDDAAIALVYLDRYVHNKPVGNAAAFEISALGWCKLAAVSIARRVAADTNYSVEARANAHGILIENSIGRLRNDIDPGAVNAILTAQCMDDSDRLEMARLCILVMHCPSIWKATKLSVTQCLTDILDGMGKQHIEISGTKRTILAIARSIMKGLLRRISTPPLPGPSRGSKDNA